MLVLILFLIKLTKPEIKLSKAMRNNLKAEEEFLNGKQLEQEEIEAITQKKERLASVPTITFQKLRSVLNPLVNPSAVDTSESRWRHLVFPKEKITNGASCHTNADIWGCIGESHPWDLVFIDHSPMERRTADTARLLRTSRLVVIHDTENYQIKNHMNLPQDFIDTMGRSWNGRNCFTDISDLTTVIVNSFLVEKQIWTSVIQGDLDTDGETFNSVVTAFQTIFKDVNGAYRHYNKENKDYGTHLRLTLTAALLTQGDILELGTGHFSTQILHTVLEHQETETENSTANKSHGHRRKIVSVESDPKWFAKYAHLANSFHQLVFLPLWSCRERRLTCQDMIQELGDQCTD